MFTTKIEHWSNTKYFRFCEQFLKTATFFTKFHKKIEKYEQFLKSRNIFLIRTHIWICEQYYKMRTFLENMNIFEKLKHIQKMRKRITILIFFWKHVHTSKIWNLEFFWKHDFSFNSKLLWNCKKFKNVENFFKFTKFLENMEK